MFHRLRKPLFLIASGLVFGCAPSELVVPPPGDLPYPYSGSHTKKDSTNELAEGYAEYLNSTKMLPSTPVCEGILKNDLMDEADLDRGSMTWVTKPFLAFGSFCCMYSITEAHITYPGSSGKDVKKTFQCFVSYADYSETDIWRSGQLKYGGCLRSGHGKFTGCPAR